MRRLAFRGLLILSVCAASGRVSAQTTSLPDSARLRLSPERKGTWVSIGLGAGSAVKNGGALLLGAGLHVQRGNLLYSARLDGLASGFDSEVDQYAFVVGRTNSDETSAFRSASVGLAFVHRTTCVGDCGLLSEGPSTTESSNTVGLSFAADLALRHGDRKGWGFGLTTVGNINSEASFAAVGLSVSGGRWR